MARSNGNPGHGGHGVPPAPPRPAAPTWQGGPDPYAAFHPTSDPRTVPAGYPQAHPQQAPQPQYAPPPQPYGYDPAAYGQPPQGHPAPHGHPEPAPEAYPPAYPQPGGWAPSPREPHPLNLADFAPGGHPHAGHSHAGHSQGGPPPAPMPPTGRLPMHEPTHRQGAPGWDPRSGSPTADYEPQPQYYADPHQPGSYPAPAHGAGYPPLPQSGYGQPAPFAPPAYPAPQLAQQPPPPALAYPPDNQTDLYDDPEDGYADEPKSKRRSLMVVGALVGAICVGGGLAYVYKTLAGSGGGATPLLKADSSPTRARVQAAGGDKVAERFGSAAPVAAAPEQDPGRPRTVATQTITVTPPPASNAPPPTAQSGVPGLVLDGGNLGPRPLPPVVPSAPAANAGGPAPVILPPARPAPPVAPPPSSVALAPPAPQPVPKVVRPPPPPKASDAFVPGANAAAGAAAAPTAAPKASLGASPTSPAPTGGNGFVAVVASQKDRLAAMKAFADLQQKYPAVLGSKLAEVQEVNLGEAKGGVWFRAVVGPPGSREAAAKICADLRGAGLAANQCWATAY